jgi:hypothetical protein
VAAAFFRGVSLRRGSSCGGTLFLFLKADWQRWTAEARSLHLCFLLITKNPVAIGSKRGVERLAKTRK